MEKTTTLPILAILKPKQPYEDFAIQELKSLLAMVGIDPLKALRPEIEAYKGEKPTTYRAITSSVLQRKYFARLEIEPEQVPLLQEIADRAVMTRTFLRLYGQGPDADTMIKNLDLSVFQREVDTTESFYFHVTATFKSIKRDEQVREMEKFSCFTWKGKCNVQTPDRIFWMIQNWEFVEKEGTSFYEQIFFGKEIVKTNRDDKTFNAKYNLKNRLYLGPTSTDHELAFLMVNQGRVRSSDIILDPFAGTGSILVAASHFRCLCFGTEIDYRVIRGKGVGRKNPNCDVAAKFGEVNVYSNFEQYGFDKPEILRMDCTNGLLKDQHLFDAIVCDPPYGLRASARETGLKDKRVKKMALIEEKIKNKTDEEKAIIEAQRQSHTYVEHG